MNHKTNNSVSNGNMNKKLKKETIEWVVLIAVIGTLYFTGWYVEVGGFVQRGIVASGLMKPKLIDEHEQLDADYGYILIDQEGKKVAMSSFEGKTIFLNFWATWCPPCIAEMPDINNLYNDINSEDVIFLLVSVDDDFEKAKKFIKKKEFNFPIYTAFSSRPEVFRAQSIPSTFVISPKGKIIAKRQGMAKYNTEEFKNLLVGNK